MTRSWSPLGSFKTRAGHAKDQGMIRGLELSASLTQPLGRGKGLEIELVTSDPWSHQNCLHKEPARKPLNNRVWRASGLVNAWRCWEGGGLGEAVEAPCASSPTPNRALCFSSVCLLLSCVLYSRPVNTSELFFWVLWDVLANYWTWGSGVVRPPDPHFAAELDRSGGDSSIQYLWLKSGPSWGTEPLNLWIWHYLQVVSVSVE